MARQPNFANGGVPPCNSWWSFWGYHNKASAIQAGSPRAPCPSRLYSRTVGKAWIFSLGQAQRMEPAPASCAWEFMAPKAAGSTKNRGQYKSTKKMKMDGNNPMSSVGWLETTCDYRKQSNEDGWLDDWMIGQHSSTLLDDWKLTTSEWLS